MSAGNFTNTYCQMSSVANTFWFGVVQPETETFASQGVVNTPPTPPAGTLQLVPFKVSKKNGEPGYRPAMVLGYFPDAVPAGGYQKESPLRIPVLNPALVAAAISGINTASGNTYQGQPFFITGVNLEDLN